MKRPAILYRTAVNALKADAPLAILLAAMVVMQLVQQGRLALGDRPLTSLASELGATMQDPRVALKFC